MTSKFSLVEHKRVVVHKDGKEWLSVQRLHYTTDKVELVLIRSGDKRLELVISEEEARTFIDAVERAIGKKVEKPITDMEEWKRMIGKDMPLEPGLPYAPYHPINPYPDESPYYIPPVTCGSPSLPENQHMVDVVGDAYESSKIES